MNARSNAILRSLGREGNIVKTIPNRTNKPNVSEFRNWLCFVKSSAHRTASVSESATPRKSHEQTQRA